jgi:hypothetical protein
MNQSPEKLMTNQFTSNQKINNLIQLASEYIECGPECQENKKSKELHDKYIKSQTVLKMAPDKLEQNKKNYYVYTYGPAYYEDIKKNEMSDNASEIISKISDEFNSQVETALKMNLILQTTNPSENCADQYPVIQKELNHQLDKKTDNMLINNRETYYSNESIERLELWNKFWVFIYYFVIVIFLILCFPKTKYELIKYGVVLGLSFLYIFIINHSLLLFYNNKLKILISIIYFIILLIIILFILYKIATSFKYILINLTDVISKIYSFSEK